MAAIIWTGAAGDGNFNNSLNWSPQQIPGSTDTVTISTAAATTVTISVAEALQALTLGKLDTLAVTGGGTLTVGNTATANATLSVAGTLAVNGTGYNADLVIGGPKVTLSGGGLLSLNGGGSNNRIVAGAAGDALVNTNVTIAGAGQIGAGSALAFTNNAGGVVDANGSSQLVINTGTLTGTNAGLLEATGAGGGLVIQSAFNDGTSGRIAANGGNVYLNNTDILGGTLSSTAGFSVQVSNLATIDGTAHAVTNTGSLLVNSGNTLTVLGTLNNTGTLALTSGGYNADVAFGIGGMTSSTVTLTGAGTIALSDGPNQRLYGSNAGDTLVNLNNIIEGSGTIGLGQLNLVNDGTISATGTNAALVIDTTSLINNALMEGVGPAGLIIEAVVNETGGGTLLSAGGLVQLDGATIQGGVLNSTNGGSIVEAGGSSTLDGSTQTVTNLGSIEIVGGATLSLLGTFTNHGQVGLGISGYNTDLVIGSPTVSLTGSGTIALSDGNGNNHIYGSAVGNELININNVIEGSGQLGIGQLVLVNQAGGVIDATGSVNQLVINTGSTIINDGLIEATGAAGLALESTVSNVTGTILAANSTAFLNGADVQGGLLKSTGTGLFAANGQTILDGSANAVTLVGALAIEQGDTLSVLGSLINQATISFGQSGYNTDFIVDNPTVTLTGGGTLSLSDANANNRIYGASGSDILDNVNNLIEGSGQIGANQLTLINEASGVIDATGTANILTIQTGSTVINKGLIEATGAAGMAIASTINDTSGGTILSAGSTIYLNGGDIIGGILKTNATGLIIANGQTTLDGSSQAVTFSGNMQIGQGDTLTVLGSLVNQGTITLEPSGYATDFIIASPTLTLSGGGTIALTDNNTANRIYGASGSDVLDNVNNLIEGSGQLGAGQLTLINEKLGVIDATGTNAQLILNATTTNNGLIEATGSAGMAIESVVDSSGGGTILAANSTIDLNGADLKGGLLKTTGTGSFADNGFTTIDGSAHAVTLAGVLDLLGGTTLSMLGSLVNQGTIAFAGSGYNTDLIINSPTLALSGGGTIVLSDDNTANRIYGASTADVLDNVNNLIEGSGQIGAGQMTLVNAGTISATGINGLYINLGSTGLNSGTMLGVGSGGLILQNGTYTNTGLIQADDGSSVTFQSGAVLTNDSATGTLTGGSYAAVANGHGATLNITGAVLKSLNATLELSGAGAAINFGGVSAATSLTTIGGKGVLEVLNGAAFTDKKGVTNSGTIVLGGGTFKAGHLTEKASASLSGFGTLAASLTSGGTISATGGALLLDGAVNTISSAISGTGTLDFDHGTTNWAAGASLTTSAAGMINGATLNLESGLTFAGTFDISGAGAAASTISGTGTFTNGGLFEQTAKAAATVSAAFSNSGTIETTAGHSLSFTGGLANTGIIIDNGILSNSAALTGGSLAIGGAGASATLATTAGSANSTLTNLTIGGGVLNTSGTVLTVTGDYDNTASGSGNAYTPFAGVTGTIDGQGTQLAVVGVNGTHITTVNGTLTITVAAGGKAQFKIENSGVAGSAALRGALETTVNGGNINGTALTGSGVTAGNFGPILAGGASGIYTIAYSGGTLSGEAIHFASDFANVAGLTIDIVAAAAASAPPSAVTGGVSPQHDVPDLLSWHHVGHGF